MSKAFAEHQEDGQEKLPAPTPEQTTPAPKEFSWWDFMESADDSQIQKKLPEQIKKIAEGCGFDLSKYCVLSLYEPHNSIDTSDSNRIFAALQAQNPKKDKDVFLLIACPGGESNRLIKSARSARRLRTRDLSWLFHGRRSRPQH